MNSLVERVRALVGDTRFLVALSAALGAAVTAFAATFWAAEPVDCGEAEEQVSQVEQLNSSDFDTSENEVENANVTNDDENLGSND